MTSLPIGTASGRAVPRSTHSFRRDEIKETLRSGRIVITVFIDVKNTFNFVP